MYVARLPIMYGVRMRCELGPSRSPFSWEAWELGYCPDELQVQEAPDVTAIALHSVVGQCIAIKELRVVLHGVESWSAHGEAYGRMVETIRR